MWKVKDAHETQCILLLSVKHCGRMIVIMFLSLFFCFRYNFPESLSVAQFCVCANLGELEYKQKKKKESKESSSGCGLLVALLDSEHQVIFGCGLYDVIMTVLL